MYDARLTGILESQRIDDLMANNLLSFDSLCTLGNNIVHIWSNKTTCMNEPKSRKILLIGCKEPINVIVLLICAQSSVSSTINITVVEKHSGRAQALSDVVDALSLSRQINICNQNFWTLIISIMYTMSP
jgi:hypothetical protein